MPELRQNIATKEWVIIANERAKRPHDYFHRSQELTEDRPVWMDDCPFCPGNEIRSEDVMQIPEQGEWRVRVVINKYPALDRDGVPSRTFEGVRRHVAGVGYHEIIVESPRHNTCPALESPEEVALTMMAFQRRGHEIIDDPSIEHVTYFKNHGESAGTSLEHPHTQLIGLPLVPQNIRARNEEARRYFDDTGECPHCRMYDDELDDGSRIIATNDCFAAFIPYAAPSPFHTWIIPRAHHPSFLNASERELRALGSILKTVLLKLYIGLNDPDYNYVIRSAPYRDQFQEYLHWYVTIVPRVTRAAGFELGSGMYINTALPRQSAAFLRNIDIDTAAP